MPLIRPPYPSERGLWSVPSVVQNAETLAHAAWIISHSADAFASVGSDASHGTKLVTMMGRVAEPGLLEVPLGTPLGELVAMAGGATGTTKALFIGGPGGGALDAGELGTPYDYEPLEAAGAIIGSGAVLVADGSTCMVDSARFFADFSAREACGKAVPCRIGTRRLVEALDRILAATPRPNDFTLLRELSSKVSDTALCKLERLAPGPILTTLARFEDEYRAHAERGECLAGACQTARLRPLLEPLGGIDAAAPLE
jgi:NADH-quinone oxidoreductase subunit F